MLLAAAVFTPHFADLEWRDGRLFGAMIDILRNGAPVVLLSVGMTLVIAAGGIDLSVGSLMALGGAVAALLITTAGWPAPAAALAGIAVAGVAGAVNGLMVSWVGLQPIVATLVMLVAARGAGQALAADQKVRFSGGVIEDLARGAWLGLPMPVYVAGAAALIAAGAVRWTLLGPALHAAGENPRAARLCGIRVRGVWMLTYITSGVLAGVAGLIAAGDIGEADTANCGLYLELDAILAVVIGGTSLTGGRAILAGSVLGALLMQTLTVMLQMNGVPSEQALVVKAVVVLAVAVARSPGAAEGWRRFRARRGVPRVEEAPS
ncbi:MAG: ABC transporter permease [Phycisphaerales bacterium]|nr:ABC transporter permease [Phycisphaerales bacterium]